LGEVWSGIEVKLKATQKTVEKLFYVQPGADPSKIQVQVDGAKGLKLSKDGEIIIKTGLGELKLSKPIAWQEKDGKKLPVEVSYKLIGKNRYSFEVAKADPSLPIVIDPLLASTFIGGDGREHAFAIALDNEGHVYVTGWTLSPNFPTTDGAYDRQCGTDGACTSGNYVDVFVSKFSNDLSQLLASTFIGGNGDDSGRAIAIDSSGNVYVTGTTTSSNYPTTPGAYDTQCGTDGTCNGSYSDVFVSKLSNDLSQLRASTFIGGSGDDFGSAIALDRDNPENVYVIGYTYSSNYPTTPGAYDTQCGTDGTCNGGRADVFVSKLSNDLSQLLASTFIGGSGYDYGYGIALDGDSPENVYVTGYTYSSDYPTTPNAYDTIYNGGSADVFVSKLSNNLNQLLASTFIGGSATDRAYSIALDGSGNVYVTGYTDSSDYPTTSGAYDTQCGTDGTCNGGRADVFVSKLDSNLSSGYTLSINPTPTNGNVTSSPAGINCGSGGSTCSASFSGTVTLTATPSTGYTFAGWTGDCSSCGTSTTCTITMNANKTCSANFTESGGGGGGSGGGSGGGGGGCSMTGSASSMAGLWNILVWLSVPAFALARRIRRK
jgi:uncharacterized repeat protein (TIGR02543 family)